MKPKTTPKSEYEMPEVLLFEFECESGFAGSDLENPGEDEPSDWD